MLAVPFKYASKGVYKMASGRGEQKLAFVVVYFDQVSMDVPDEHERPREYSFLV